MTHQRHELTPGVYRMTNEEYHAAPGVNKSTLEMVLDDPASIQWMQGCPIDIEKLKTLDFGSACHTAILEPDLFDSLYAVEPSVNKRTTIGKQGIEDFHAINGHKTIITHDDLKKINFMAGSALAHPLVKSLIDNKVGAEVSTFALDPNTGLILKSRNDLESDINGMKIIADLKTIDDLKNIPRAVHEYRYHFQEHHYKKVYEFYHGVLPDAFLFIFMSKTISLGRYPVQVVELDLEAKQFGEVLWQEAISKYVKCKNQNNWPGIRRVFLPSWAFKN